MLMLSILPAVLPPWQGVQSNLFLAVVFSFFSFFSLFSFSPLFSFPLLFSFPFSFLFSLPFSFFLQIFSCLARLPAFSAVYLLSRIVHGSSLVGGAVGHHAQQVWLGLHSAPSSSQIEAVLFKTLLSRGNTPFHSC